MLGLYPVLLGHKLTGCQISKLTHLNLLEKFWAFVVV